MKNLHKVAAILLFAASLPSMAQMRMVEMGYEATPGNVRLPTSETGELTLQGCATCKAVRLRATANTRYVIGGVQVSLAEITRYIASHPEANLAVMQLKDTSELSRLVVHLPKRAQ